MEYRHYETLFILTPVLSQKQAQDSIGKFRRIIVDMECEIMHEDDLGIKRFAYSIDSKSTGIYKLFEFRGLPSVVKKLEMEFSRDDRVIRFMTIMLDKHGIEYNKNKRLGLSKNTEKEDE